jgi:hypothetical protein
MTSIEVVTSDSKIWHAEKTYLEIVHASQQGPVELHLLTEGPCCQTSGIDDMLTSIINRFDFDPTLYTIITGNQLPSSQYCERRISWAELELAKKNSSQHVATKSTLRNKFAIFIGRSNWQRLGLASYLWANYKDCTTMTYHFDSSMDYHIANFGLEELILKEPSARPYVYNFIEQLPIRSKVMSYPILWNQGAFDLEKYYQDIFCEIVCETYFTGRTFFLTEKTLRCIINGRPFMVQGPKWFLHNLKRLGFKTFSNWWDEGYDEDPSDARYATLKNGIDWIAQQTPATINAWYQEMQPTLEHNRQTLQQLTNKKILETEFFYE